MSIQRNDAERGQESKEEEQDTPERFCPRRVREHPPRPLARPCECASKASERTGTGKTKVMKQVSQAHPA